MKRLLLFIGLVIATVSCKAQDKPKNIDKIPPFKILKQDSTWFSASNLKKDKPVMIIYFSPDCSHCQHLMYELKPKMKQLRNTQVVMVTFTEYSMLKMIKDFCKTFDLAKYPNFTVGTEAHTYLVQRYYQVRTTPYIAVYDRNGKLVRAFEKSPAIDTLMAAVKKG
jgi:thioredoxin-related protein